MAAGFLGLLSWGGPFLWSRPYAYVSLTEPLVREE